MTKKKMFKITIKVFDENMKRLIFTLHKYPSSTHANRHRQKFM